MANRERTKCYRCGEIIEAVADKGLAIFMFGQTIGMKPRRKQGAPTIYFCPACVMVSAVHPGFPEWDVFNFAAHKMIRNLVGAFRPETQQALAKMFELVIEREGRISEAEITAALAEPEILPPARRLKQAS